MARSSKRPLGEPAGTRKGQRENTLEVHGGGTRKPLGKPAGTRKGLVRCVTCVHGPLHRYGSNPILASCLKKPQEHNERFPYQVEVANCLRSCSMHAEATEVKEVEQRERVA